MIFFFSCVRKYHYFIN